MIFSPVTNNSARVADCFNIKDIVEGYKKDVGIDVSLYFENITSLLLYESSDTGMRFFHHPVLIKLEKENTYAWCTCGINETSLSVIESIQKLIDNSLKV